MPLMDTWNVQAVETCPTILDKVESLMGVHEELQSFSAPSLLLNNLGSPDFIEICK